MRDVPMDLLFSRREKTRTGEIVINATDFHQNKNATDLRKIEMQIYRYRFANLCFESHREREREKIFQ